MTHPFKQKVLQFQMRNFMDFPTFQLMSQRNKNDKQLKLKRFIQGIFPKIYIFSTIICMATN